MSDNMNEDILSLQRIQNRLYSTSNEELPSLLTKLLPKLLPLANKEDLRNATVGVISDCIRRIKSSKCIIDLEPLISSCIHPNLLPFACNFSFTLIDITLPFIMEQSTGISKSSLDDISSAIDKRNVDVTSSLVHAIGLFEEFSVQSNSLCYYVMQLIDYLPNAINHLSIKNDGSFDHYKIKSILGNYAIDVCLLYRFLSIEGNAIVGSVQPGLSSMHIDRLTVKMKSWTLKFINDLKLKLINFIPMNIFHAHHSVLISIISVNDPTTEIAMQAMYKMKGVINFYHLDKQENTAIIVMEYLLESCLPDKNLNSSYNNNNFGKRNLMKREIRATVLRWLAKHLHQYLTKPIAVKGSVMILFKYVFPPTTENFASLLTEDIAVLNGILRLVDIITKNLSHEELSTVIMLIFQCVKKLLHSCITSFHTNLGNESGGEIDLRVSCYTIIENVSQRLLSINEVVSSEDSVNPLVSLPSKENMRNQYRKFITEDSDLLTILFKLLEKEALQQYGSASIVAIHSALSTLRQAYITASNSTTIKTSSKLRDILKKARNNENESKIRVIALQWTKAIFEWDSFMIEALIDLMDDKNPQVAMFIVSEFKHLNDYCLEQQAAIAMTVLQSILELSSRIKQQTDSIGLIYVFDIIATILKLIASENMSVIESPLLQKLLEFVLSFEFLIDSKYFLTNELLSEEFFFCSVDIQVYPNIDLDSKQLDMVREKIELCKFNVLRSMTSILQTIHTLAHAIGLHKDVISMADLETIKLIRKLSLQSGMPLYLNWLCIPEYQIRKDVGEILSLLCYSVEDTNVIDLKFASSLFRSLTMSISFLFDNGETQLTNMYSAAGSIEALAYILAVLVQKTIDCLNISSPPIEINELLKESKVMYMQLFSFIDQCLKIPFNNSIGMRVFQFVIIETLTLLANSGFIDATELLHLESNQSTKFNTISPEINSTASEKLRNNSFFLTQYFLPTYSNKIFEHVKLQVKSEDCRIAALAIELLSKLSLYYNPQEFISLIWNYLQDPELRHRKSYVYRFSWAEAVHRVSISGSLNDNFLKSIEEKILSYNNDEVLGIPDKSAYCVWLLIVTKELIHPDEVYFKKVSLNIFKQLLALFLKLLKENDVFIQDICCMGICYLYYISRKEKLYLNQSLNEVTGSSTANIERYITEEVITSLTREKRNIQPAGYSVAGTATNTSDTHNHSIGSDNRNTATAVNNGDPLLQAAAIAANELGVNINFVAEELSGANNRTENIPQDYIIYSSVCKLVKKTKSNDILFLVLSLIKRDPTLRLQSNQTFISKYTSPFCYYENEVNVADSHRINKIGKKLVDILPTLYHAKFDPNYTVRPVMIELWKTIVNKFFSQHEFNILDLIQSKVITYLSHCLHSKLWRDREASCLALEAFLPQRSWSIAIYPCLEDIYCSGLRVLDDMRESTRIAALSFMKVLCNHIERACNPLENCELTADTAIATAIPLILKKGLINSSAEARGISLGLLGRIILVSKTVSAIRKWLPSIISVLVESMSALEPQTLQYMQFHTARLRISDEELENMRIKMSQSSPLQEALDTCIIILHDVVLYDTIVISEIVECLSSAIRTGVGLATRVSASQSIVQLVERYSKFLGAGTASEISTANAFRSVVKVLTQMSSTATSLKKSITSAFGALSKVVDEDILAGECETLIHRYMSLESANLEQSTILAECIQQIVQRSGSRLAYADNNNNRDIWLLILSTAFMGTHDFDPSTKSIWVIIWEESLISSGIGSKISCLLKIFPKLLEIIFNLLNELSWHRRIQGISILRDLIQFISIQQLSSLLNLDSTNTNFSKILHTLLLLIPGKIWEGQSYVLEVVSEIVNKCKDTYISWTTTSSIEFVDGSIPVFEATANNILLKLENIVDFHKHKYTFKFDNMRLIEIKEHISNTAVADECDHKVTSSIWKLHFLGWFMVLINECQRINAGTEYILIASRALHSLPWQHLSSLDTKSDGGSSILTYLQLLPLLCKHAGIPLYEINYNNSNNKSIAVKDNQDRSGSVKVEKTNKNKRLLGNDALFGVRYIKMSHQQIATSQTVNIQEKTKQTSTHTMNIQDVQTNMQIDSLLNLEQASINDHSNDIGTDINTVVEDVEENNFPAFKCFFIECIVKGWPSLNMMKYLKSNPDYFAEELLLSIASYIISWAQKNIECEIWSIKKTTILLVGTIGNSLKLQSSDLFKVISIIELAIEETKFVKVRVEALKSLGLLLQGPNSYDLNNDESFSRRIRDIIKNTCTDHQPSVLEALSKIQNLWLS